MEIKDKIVYAYPEIVRIKLDNEISLVLESSPPTGPDEISETYKQNNPFKLNINQLSC